MSRGKPNLAPDRLPNWVKDKTGTDLCVIRHRFPEGWDQAEVDEHRFDDCPCAPYMRQEFGGGSYTWAVDHHRIPKTELRR